MSERFGLLFLWSKVIDSTFSLFKELGMHKYPNESGNPVKGWDPKPGNLVRYHLQGINYMELYNDAQVLVPKGGSTSTAKSFKVTGLPDA